MVSLDVAAIWTRILSVTAGACTAAGAPGPGTRISGKAAVTWLEGPWLAIFDFAGLRRAEREGRIREQRFRLADRVLRGRGVVNSVHFFRERR